ncbi:hypothetical protein SALBM311S_08760 [Streptomyces alboniger]
MRDAQPPRLTTLGLEGFRESFQGGAVTGQDHLRRPVHRRHTHRAFQQRRYVLLGGLHREHGATLRQRLHQPAPGRHQPHRILKRPQPGHISRHQLTDRVPTKHLRPQPERLRKPKQRHLDREQRRLRVSRLLQRLSLGAEHHLGQRPLQQRIEVRADLVESVREDREGVIKLPPHARPLTALPGEQHPEPALSHRAGHHRPAQQVLTALAEHHRPVLQHRPARQQRPAHIADIQVVARADVVPQSLHLSLQRLRITRGHHPRHEVRRQRGRDSLHGRLFLDRRLLDDHMRVRPAHTERRHTRPTRHVLPLRPLPSLRQQLNRTSRPVHMRTRRIHMQRGRQHTLPHRHHHLDHTGHTRGSLRMPDVRLHRPQPQRPILRPPLPVRGQQRLRLDRVTQRGPGAMSLHHVHITRRQPRVRQRSPDHPLLRRPIGRRQTIARPVLIDGRTPHHRQHLMPVAPGIRQPLQQQQTDTLTPPRAVRSLRERLATPVHRQPPLTTELHERLRGRHHRHPTGNREFTLSLPQRLRRQMQRDQRRRARRVHRHRRPLETEHVRQPPGHHADRVAGQHVALDVLRDGVQAGDVVLPVGADEDSATAAAQAQGGDAGPLEQLPARLQQQPLLRIHRQRLTRRDTEEVRVEVARVVEEAALADVRRAGVVGVRVVQGVDVPAPVGREVAHGVPALGDQAPQVLGRPYVTGEPAAHRHDGDRVGVAGTARSGHVRDVPDGQAAARLTGPGPLSEGLSFQVVGERDGVRVVEDERGGQSQPRRGLDTVAQLHRRQGVETQFTKGALRFDALG